MKILILADILEVGWNHELDRWNYHTWLQCNRDEIEHDWLPNMIWSLIYSEKHAGCWGDIGILYFPPI